MTRRAVAIGEGGSTRAIDPKMVRLGRDEKRFFDILVQRQEILSTTLAARVRELAMRYPRLIAIEKTTSPGAHFIAGLTTEGRTVHNAAIETADHRGHLGGTTSARNRSAQISSDLSPSSAPSV